MRLLLIVLTYACRSTQSSWWLSDHEFFYDDTGEGDSIYNTVNENITRLHYSNETGHSFSRDLKYVAEFIERAEAYRPPMRPVFSVIILDISRNVFHSVGISGNNKLFAFKWSHGSAFAFELDDESNYYVSSPGQTPIKISEDGRIGTNRFKRNVDMIPGSFKGSGGLFMFSPSDKYLAYSPSAANSTKKVIMTTYSRTDKYDFQYNMNYLQNGEEKLDFYSIFIFSVQAKKSIKMDVRIASSDRYYILGCSWVILYGQELYAVAWSNRWRNHLTITLCSFDSTSCWMVYEHQYEPRQWASFEDFSSIPHTNSSIFVIVPTRKGDNSWQHMLQIGVTIDFEFEYAAPVVSGAYDIRWIIEYRPKEDIILYEAQAPHPWNRHVYLAYVDNNTTEQQDRCLTCGLPNCTYQNGFEVSPGDKLHIALWCNGPGPKYRTLLSFDDFSLHRTEMKYLTQPNSTVEHPVWKIDTFRLANGYDAIVRIYEGDTNMTSVPVTLSVYGGPDFNMVEDEYEKRPYPIGYKSAIVRIDVRGSGGRGWNYRSPIYGGLVTVEVDDTLEAMKMVLEKYPRLDRNRVSVYGRSFGGSMSLALAEKAPPSFFKCAISVAPVTNFLYYWAVYAETYMGDAPPSAYTDLTRYVSAFNQTKLLLVHGLRDDRVHFRHSAVLAEALQQADIPFEFMVYPNQGHSVTGDSATHLDHLLESFITKCYE